MVNIGRVEAFHVDWGAGRSRSAWVRIWTDAGVDGLGEASPMVHGNASLEIIASAFTPMLLGADPLEPREVQDVVFRTPVQPVQGKFVLSDAPGLGLELDENALRRRMVPWTSAAATG